MARVWTRRVPAMALLALGVAGCGREPTPGLARGEALYDTCTPCHGTNGGGNATLSAPAIAGLPRWYVQAQLEKFRAGHRGGTAFDTTGIRMKSMSWSLAQPGDLESVAEFVAGMAPTDPTPLLQGGDAQAGQATFQVCAACHGADARGNEAVHAPPLVGQSDWYLLAQLHKFKAGWRGANPADTWGATMRPNALMLDDAAMANVVAYVQTLR